MRATILTVLVLSALHLCADTSTPYGVCAHVTRSQEFPTRLEAFKLMRAAGVRWVRSDFDWSYGQPNADT